MKFITHKYNSFREACDDLLDNYGWENLSEEILGFSSEQVSTVLAKPELSINDLPVLLSPAASEQLETMAQRSRKLTLQRFGKTVLMYVPLYVSNYCTNLCVYCGFNAKNKVKRLAMSIDEAVNESMLLHKMGFQHILLVSGEHPDYANVDYLCELSGRLRDKFSSICVEVQPLSQDDYAKLIKSGVDCVTCYQETYNKKTYSKVHPGGRKSNYNWRINTVERAAKAGIRKIGVSPLYGLDNWRTEALFTGFHSYFLMTQYWQTQVSISFPRLRGAAGGFVPENPLTDRQLAQLICVFRLVLPDVHLVLSTREPANTRDNMLHLGITQMSAASSTSPLGYSNASEAGEQFDVVDKRSAAEVAEAIKKAGYEPVWKDWDREYLKNGLMK
ncbi:MAG: 2-iminoacetate synthase ThiH [Chlamydiae bacterium]|nr:MAG: 2-iminoacetate synthase ThiH [Chlamydiota bacterium]